MKCSRHLLMLALVFTLGACAHPIVITPDLAKFDRKDVNPIDRNVAYVMSTADREKEVTTQGGGGDKVKYKPYKELEAALQKVLSNLFTKVMPLDARPDAETMRANNISFVFHPSIGTSSSSASAFTWPPTDFTVILDATAIGPDGQENWKKQLVGQGHAEFSEFKSDFALSAKRASEEAFRKLQLELNTDPIFRR